LGSFFDRSLEQAPIQVVGDHPLAKRLEGALRKGRPFGSKAAEHQLHPQIHDGELDQLRVGGAQVPLHQHGHGHQARRDFHLACPARAVHRLELVLKYIVHQLAPMHPKKAQQLAHPTEPREQHCLLLGDILRRRPTRQTHRTSMQVGRAAMEAHRTGAVCGVAQVIETIGEFTDRRSR
jgi:hypothetical protein